MDVQSHNRAGNENSILSAISSATLCVALVVLLASEARAEWPPEAPQWSGAWAETDEAQVGDEENVPANDYIFVYGDQYRGAYAGVALSHKASFKFTQQQFIGPTHKGRAKGNFGTPPVLGFQWFNWNGESKKPLWGFDISVIEASGRLENEDSSGKASFTFIPFTVFAMYRVTGGKKSDDYPAGRLSGSFGLGLVYALMMMDVDFGGELGSKSFSSEGVGFAVTAGSSYRYSPRGDVYLNLRYMSVSGESENWTLGSCEVHVESLQAALGYSHNY